MNITASGAISKQSIRTLVRINAFGRKNPRKRFVCCVIFFCVILFVILAELLLFESDGWVLLSAVVLCCACIGMEFFAYFMLPLLYINLMKNLIGATNRFEFRENSFSVYSKEKLYSETSTLSYEFLKKVYETSEYIFLFLPNNTAFVVEKSTVSHNEDCILQNVLCEKVPKYIICHC